MSWRIIFAVLIVMAGASAWGGLRLGDWLVAHGPVAPPVLEHPELANDVPVLDANGLPYQAQPPQPLMNGQQGVPEPPVQLAWQIPETALNEVTSNAAIDIATTKISMDEAIRIAEFGNNGSGLQGIADISGLGLGGDAYNQTGNAPLQPIEMAPPPPPPSTGGSGNAAWRAELRQALQACSAENFFNRPSCAWTARNKYCEPNNAWGRTSDCPAKSF
ncbi:hypothetical protein [Pollutimonas harenae]|uniref:Uncharacterized protein n=1 Tax=Pollutimonas harenae TaxID=657015 RepID=A0A853GYJ8_9BURK|nr:hypothetical protein [Pollutimonas harenae]NYT84469.1 hypothetical protein [Pollutimonas harenae]TEA73133.1 hypothetical protein ERD84_04280 [Pollutimonas harenae]